MGFLVRKIVKMKSIELISSSEDTQEVSADPITCEFRTTDNKLSTWFIPSIDKLDDAVLAIATTSSKIDKMDFIVIDTDIMNKINLEYENTPPGSNIPLFDFQDKHYDIIDINYKKLEDCIKLYKETINKDNGEGKLIIRYSQGKIKELIVNAYKDKRIEVNNANKDLRPKLLELCIA